LVLHPPPGSLPDRGLFRVADGELTLEKLEFYGRAAVTVSGGRCTLRDCVISLPEEPAGRSAALYISEPGADMTRRPQVTLENCLIRGRGAGLWVPTARPLDFEVTHSLFALAGPLIGIGAPIRPARPEDSIRVSFTRMTALVTGPIIDLRPGRGSTAWIPVTVTSGRCLFSTPDPEPPAPILSVVPAPDGTDPRSYVKWFSTDGANWYDRDEDDVFIELVPADDTIEPTLEEAPGWRKYTGEKPGTIRRIEFQQALVSVADLVTAKPEQFLVTDGLAGADPTEVGADVNRVPRPTMKE
jgi:hypothetical protein